MGYYKERASTTIIADLKRWQPSPDARHITGTLRNSTDEKEYPDGTRMTFLNVSLLLFHKSEAFGEMHFVMKSPNGNYFRLNISDCYIP